MTYRLAYPAVCRFFQLLRSLDETRLAEVESILRQFWEAPEALEPIEKKTLVDRVGRGEVILLDVRPVEEYRAGHISGAISMPLQELTANLSKFQRNQEFVAYCRGPYCVLAVEAVKLLQARGLRALRLEDGVRGWRAQGLPVARGQSPK